LARVLNQDHGYSLGRAVLFVVSVKIPEVEANLTEIARKSGMSTARLQEIVDTAKQVLDTSAPTVPEQHTVSQVLMRRFVRDTPNGRGVRAYSFDSGLLDRPRNPRSVGKLTNFVKIDSEATERLWNQTETKMRAALDAAQTQAIFKQPEHVQTIKEAIALHFARSLEVLESHRRLWTMSLENFRNQPGLESLFVERFGLFPPSDRVAREVMAKELTEETRQLYESGMIFRLRVVDLFEQVLDVARNSALQIVRPEKGEFLIGDSPAFTIDPAGKRVGILGGVPFLNATTVVLPLGPERLAALHKVDQWGVAPKRLVDALNGMQVQKAQGHVYFRPGAHFIRFLQSQRPPQRPRRRQ